MNTSRRSGTTHTEHHDTNILPPMPVIPATSYNIDHSASQEQAASGDTTIVGPSWPGASAQDRGLTVACFQRKVKMTSHNTTWYIDKAGNGNQPAMSPKLSGLHDGDLYLFLINDKVSRMWMRVSQDGYRWKRVFEGTEHPNLSNRVLFLRKDQKPSWVRPETIARYRRGCMSPLKLIDIE